MGDYKKVVDIKVSFDKYRNWDKYDTEWLLTVFEGGYCIECGCLCNFDLKYDYVPIMGVMYGEIYEVSPYRVIGFTCLECGVEYKIRIGY